MLRKAGDVIMSIGAAIAVVLTIALALHINLPGLPWLFAVGLVKLGYTSALGMLGAGSVVRRLGIRAETRTALEASTLPTANP